jgi:metal-responsive CopG/Arc/MetJ family transcriptional regulator
MEKKEKQAARYEPQERISSFVLRLPERYALALDGLVEKGAAKSRNDLLVEIVERFITSLQKEAQKREKNG